jgi:hypothetical protein
MFVAEVQVGKVIPPKDQTQSGIVTLNLPCRGSRFGEANVRHHFLTLSLPDSESYIQFNKRFPVGTRFISQFDLLQAPTPVIVKDETGVERVMTTKTGETVMRGRVAFVPRASFKYTREIARIEALKMVTDLEAPADFDLLTVEASRKPKAPVAAVVAQAATPAAEAQLPL